MKYTYYQLGIMAAVVSFLGFVVENIWLAMTKGYINNRNMNAPFLLGYGLLILFMYAVFGTPAALRMFAKEKVRWKRYLVYESHNNYLFVFISTGFVGAGLFLCFLVLVLVRVIRYILRHPQLSLWTITTLAVVAFGLVEALFMNSVFLKINDVSFIFWLALGALMLETEDKVPAAERTL